MLDDAQAMTATVHRPVSEDWFSFHTKHPYIGIGRSGESGEKSEWQELLRRYGSKVPQILQTLRNGDRKVYFSQVLQALEQPVQTGPTDVEKAKRYSDHKRDMAIHCICLSPEGYADRMHFIEERPDLPKVERTFYNGMKISFTHCIYSHGREETAEKARKARTFMCEQLGIPDERKYYLHLYDTVSRDRQMIAWLDFHGMLPKRYKDNK